MNDIKTMLEDAREIAMVYEFGEAGTQWVVGSNGITRIAIYREKGPSDWLAFAAIYVGDEIRSRLPMATLGMMYKPVTPEQPT